MPVAHYSTMDTVEGMAPAIDQYNRISKMADTKRIISKAASYSCLAEESGAVFVCTSAATFTLPAVADSTGVEYWFFNQANVNMTIAAPTGTMVTDGDAAANSIAYSTSSHKIGGAAYVVCDGTNWFTFSAGNLSAIPTVST